MLRPLTLGVLMSAVLTAPDATADEPKKDANVVGKFNLTVKLHVMKDGAELRTKTGVKAYYADKDGVRRWALSSGTLTSDTPKPGDRITDHEGVVWVVRKAAKGTAD